MEGGGVAIMDRVVREVLAEPMATRDLGEPGESEFQPSRGEGTHWARHEPAGISMLTRSNFLSSDLYILQSYCWPQKAFVLWGMSIVVYHLEMKRDIEKYVQ